MAMPGDPRLAEKLCETAIAAHARGDWTLAEALAFLSRAMILTPGTPLFRRHALFLVR